ncbi:Acg family FMN-binding oxidoreductase [Amycolatopsis nalaikhensis]|uniref:Nitroreductase family protein n=1 Tax=Amycolatopsis nalaikhensis TaxID=715472 RepID=A0ABY8XEB1_9PSEU|nr:nitroreductase family protein [Amycolatopsis sp. 2-2]WIV53955.1 nitroreductase family protein [Amycolatopsis sp. 2-2]
MSAVEGKSWTAAETDVLVRSMMRAPSVHNTQPWLLEVEAAELRVRERAEPALPHHDPRGRDRAASCGAAVANLELAVRTLGRAVTIEFLPAGREPDLVARIAVGAEAAPTRKELHRYGAIARRASHRAPFEGVAVPAPVVRKLVDAGGAPGVETRPVRPGREVAVVARLLHYAAERFRSDSGYQRELSLWTIRDERAHRHGVGLPASRVPAGSVPWAGLVQRSTELPDTPDLEERLARETLLVFVTTDDARLDHVRAGYALERAWLAAVDFGLAAAVLTQPLHLEPVRSALCEDLGLTGFPQALLRIGYAAEADPPSPRRAVQEVLRDGPDPGRSAR